MRKNTTTHNTIRMRAAAPFLEKYTTMLVKFALGKVALLAYFIVKERICCCQSLHPPPAPEEFKLPELTSSWNDDILLVDKETPHQGLHGICLLLDPFS